MASLNNAWMVRPFPHHINRIVEFLDDEIVALGWPGIGSLECKGLPDIKRLVQRVYKPTTLRSLGQNAGELDTLVNRVQSGNYVLVPSPEGCGVYVGRVRGTYQYDRSKDDQQHGYPHQRAVTWLLGRETVSRADLPRALLGPLKARQAICSVDAGPVQDCLDLLQPESERDGESRGRPAASLLDDHWFDDTLSAAEGERRLLLRTHFAREGKLRAAKIALSLKKDGRLRCQVPRCGFDFETVYGPIGRHFAHVHHLKPLSTLKRAGRIGLEDLAVVCANCHAMIHRGGECRPLGSLISKRGS